MNFQKRPKLYPPLALLAALPGIVRQDTRAPSFVPHPDDLRRLVAAMVD